MLPPLSQFSTAFNFIHIFAYLLLLIISQPVRGKDQYVVPLNMGMKASISWDIANIFNRFPIQGALSVALALALNAILFFGVITAPFGYFFGIPSKKYVLGDVAVRTDDKDAAAERSDFIEDAIFSDFPLKRSPVYIKPAPRSLTQLYTTNFDTNTTEQGYDDPRNLNTGFLDTIWKLFVDAVNKPEKPNVTLLDGMFSFMPQSGSVRSKSCDLMTVCYAHGVLKRFPNWVIQTYHLFSGKLSTIPLQFKDAILRGMEDNENCAISFSDSCSETLFTIVLKSYLNFLPKEALSKSMPKRKQAMYL